MPFYILQTKGKNVDRVNAIVAAYRHKVITQKEAFVALAELYCRTQDRHPAGLNNYHYCDLTDTRTNRHVKLEDYYNCKAAERLGDVDYFIYHFFPHFALTFPSDSGYMEADYNRTCRKMNYNGKATGDKFEVSWEY